MIERIKCGGHVRNVAFPSDDVHRTRVNLERAASSLCRKTLSSHAEELHNIFFTLRYGVQDD